jgi:hypothetical protein
MLPTMEEKKKENFGISNTSGQGWGVLHWLIWAILTIIALYVAYRCSDRKIEQFLLAFFCSICYIGYYASQGFKEYVPKVTELVTSFGFKY